MSQRLLWPTIFVFVLAAATRPQISRKHDLQLAFVGYTGLATSIDCQVMVDTLGYDSLVGTVNGIETPNQPDEDVVYTGTLRRTTKIDYCITRPAPTVDQVAWCKATLTAAARMVVEVTVYGEADRGAWIKAKPAGAPDSVRVAGNCLQADMDTIRADYPSGSSAGTPDGQPIEESTPARFIVGGIPRLRPGYFPPNTREPGWGLRVLRSTPP